MADEAVLGMGAKFSLHNGTTLVEFDGVISINRPNLAVGTTDTTHHGSVGGVRTFMPTLGDPGEISVELFYSPGSATDALILAQLAAMAARTALKRAFKASVVEVDGTYQEVTGDCIPTGYEVSGIPIDDKMMATFTAKVTGATTQAAAA